MGVFDQAANYGYRAEPQALTRRVLDRHGLSFLFRELYETRTTPLPGQRDRTADKVVILDDPAQPAQPWLLLWEFQASHDPEKLDVTLVEAARLRTDFRYGPDRKDKYKVLTALIYLTGICPEGELNMRAGDFGTLHRPLVWNIAEEQALQALDDVAEGRSSWGLLFWISLMHGGGEPATITRWMEVVTRTVPGRRDRGDLGKIALVFAELAGCRAAWLQALETWDMVESQLYLEWTAAARREGEINNMRKVLFELLESRFPGAVPTEVREVISKQDSLEMLDDWFKAALKVASIDNFRAYVLR